jgi:acyl carrier protein
MFEQIQKIIAEQFNMKKEDITSQTSFYNDLGADSLDLFQIITQIEDEFDIEFSNEDAEKIKTVGDAVNYIKSKKG